jgi:hypothetical protein
MDRRAPSEPEPFSALHHQFGFFCRVWPFDDPGGWSAGCAERNASLRNGLVHSPVIPFRPFNCARSPVFGRSSIAASNPKPTIRACPVVAAARAAAVMERALG